MNFKFWHGKKETSVPQEPNVHIVVTLPPPYTGMTKVSSEMVDRFKSWFSVFEYLVSKPPRAPKWIWFIYRQVRFTLSLIYIATHGRARDITYFVPDSGKGLWGNVLLQLPLLVLARPTVILHHHVYSYVTKRDWRMKVIVSALGKKATHIVLSQDMGEKLRANYGDNLEYFVIGNASFTALNSSNERIGDCKAIGFISNITRDKGIGLYMDLVRRLNSSQHEVFATIAGPIDDNDLRQEIERFINEDSNRRKWIGPVYGEDKNLFFQDIDVLIFPTQYPNEAQPVTIFEALSKSIPVLATDRGCISDQLQGTGWVFSESCFIDKAEEAIESWVRFPEKYRDASRKSSFVWHRSYTQSEEAVELLMTSLAKRY